jgi:hypothetical protein
MHEESKRKKLGDGDEDTAGKNYLLELVVLDEESVPV